MKARIEQITINDETITIVGTEEAINNIATWMTCALEEAYENAYQDTRIFTANSYKQVKEQFIEIIVNLIKKG